MNRFASLFILLGLIIFPSVSSAASATQLVESRTLYEQTAPSLVGVQYVWEFEIGRRERVGTGIVVSEDGLVMTSIALFDQRIPDAQMKEFKILIPSHDHEAEEIDAVFVGRDERTNTAFVRAKSPQKWKALKFVDKPINVGETIQSVGLLPKTASYKAYLTHGITSAMLRGEIPHVLVVGGGLAAIGSPVFDAHGEAIGLVNVQPEQLPFLNEPKSGFATLVSPPLFFVPTSDFNQSLQDPPKAGEPLKIPWLGVPQQAMAGVNKDVAESMGLKDQPAIELGDIIPGSPAAKAGLKSGAIILKVDGKPLQRGDDVTELPGILVRQIRRMKVGETVTLSILTAKDKPLEDVKITLEERPKGANLAERYYAEDMGFGMRSMVFIDSYVRKLPINSKGVVVSLVKPQSSAAAAQLQVNDLVTEMNGQPVTGLNEFKKAYETLRTEKTGEALVLVVLREGNTQTIRIEPPQ